MLDKRKMLIATLALFSSGVSAADLSEFASMNDEFIGLIEPAAQHDRRVNPALDENIFLVIQDSSNMTFRVDSPIGDVWAKFDHFEGSFSIVNSSVQERSVSIVINAGSLVTDGGLVNLMLKSESFFDVENFPTMRFAGSSFEWFNDSLAVLKGDLTIKNVTRQVAFYVELVAPGSETGAEIGQRDRISIRASTTIRRSEFGIYTLLPSVSDDVNLYMSIDAVKRITSLSMM